MMTKVECGCLGGIIALIFAIAVTSCEENKPPPQPETVVQFGDIREHEEGYTITYPTPGSGAAVEMHDGKIVIYRKAWCEQ
jgi:hypothetical protein